MSILSVRSHLFQKPSSIWPKHVFGNVNAWYCMIYIVRPLPNNLKFLN